MRTVTIKPKLWRTLATSILIVGLLSGCSGGSDAEDLDELAGRLQVTSQAPYVAIVNVAEIREETGNDLSIVDGIDETTADLLAGFQLLPFLQLARLPEILAFEDMTGYVATSGEVLFRFDLSSDEMSERLEDIGFEPDGENRYVAGTDSDETETRLAPAAGIAEDGDGVLLAIGEDSSVLDRLLDDEEENDEVDDLVDLDNAAVTNLFPDGLPSDGDCRLTALTQEITGDRMVTVYLADAKESDLSDDVDDAVGGKVESVDEVDDLLALRVKPSGDGLTTSANIVRTLGMSPFCT